MNTANLYQHAQITTQYKALSEDKRCIILHPNANAEHRFFSQYVLDSLDAVYVNLQPESEHPFHLSETLAEAFRQQKHTEYIHPTHVAHTMAQQLATAMVQTDTELLFIDGCDGDVSGLLLPVLREVIPALPANKRVILRGRTLSTSLLEDPAVYATTAVVPVDDARMLIDYADPEHEQIYIEVRAFGQGNVLVNGRAINRWEGALPRALFFFFVDRAMTTRDEIFATFWPKLTIREATNVFHVTKRKISELLGVSLTIYGAGFYRISPEIDLRYDVVLFQQAVQNAAVASTSEAVALYNQALDLYREDFLTPLDTTWVQRRRGNLRANYTDAVAALAKLYHTEGRVEEALGLFLRASAIAPEREDLARTIMELYSAMEQPRHALDVYHRLKKNLRHMLKMSPDPSTVSLMKTIKRKL